MKKAGRANVTPAKDFYKNDAAQQGIENQKYTVKGNLRKLVGDLCDFCLKPVFVKKEHLPLRVKGYRFGCDPCHAAGRFKWKTEGGREKVVPTFACGFRKPGDPRDPFETDAEIRKLALLKK